MKKLILPTLILLLAVAVMISLGCVFGIAKKPVVTEARFPFSVSYEHNGETVTLEDEYYCSYNSSEASMGELDIYWDGGIGGIEEYEGGGAVCIEETESYSVYLHTGLRASYLMGCDAYDPADDNDPVEPRIEYSDNMGEEEDSDTKLEEMGIRLVSWDYPEPVENSLEFSHIDKLSREMAIVFTLIALVAFGVSVILVKKDRDTKYGIVDWISFAANIVIGVTAIPFMTLAASLIDINGDAKSLICQIIICLPAVTTLLLCLSLCLRRKGFSKSSLIVQFIGPLALFTVYIIDFITML